MLLVRVGQVRRNPSFPIPMSGSYGEWEQSTSVVTEELQYRLTQLGAC